MNSDQLESLLREADESAGEPAEPSANLADRVRSMHACRRKRNTRAKFVVALVGCYVAGIATAWILFAVATTRQPDLAQRGSHQRSATGKSANGQSHPPDPQPEQEVPNQDIDPYPPTRPSIAAERSRYELLRQLGDESHQRGDLQTAVSYYGQALDAATDVERLVSYRQDNWLLISLKRDRLASNVGTSQGDSI